MRKERCGQLDEERIEALSAERMVGCLDGERIEALNAERTVMSVGWGKDRGTECGKDGCDGRMNEGAGQVSAGRTADGGNWLRNGASKASGSNGNAFMSVMVHMQG
jgi:hypothetical protein